MIKIVTDSTADLPPDVATELGIEIVPIHVIWDGKSYRDGVDLMADDFYHRLASSSSMPTTSQPSEADFRELYQRLKGQADGILSVHISSKLSGTVSSATLAAGSMEGIRVEVVDSHFNSIGLGLIAIAAARRARSGADMDEVLAETHRAMSQIRMLGMFDTMKYLIAGGRINRSLGRMASILSIKPLMTFRHGEVGLAGAVRTYSKGMDRLLEFVKKNLPAQDIGIAHSAALKAAEKLKQDIGVLFPADKLYLSQLGASLGTHGGPGVLLVAVRTSD